MGKIKLYQNATNYNEIQQSKNNMHGLDCRSNIKLLLGSGDLIKVE